MVISTVNIQFRANITTTIPYLCIRFKINQKAIMNITQQEFEEYRKCARIIANNYEEAEELLQDTMLRICELKLPEEKQNKNYYFILMKNLYLNKKSKEKVRSKITNHTLEFNDDIYNTQEHETNIELIKQVDSALQDKLNTITAVYDTLPTYDKQLFSLHFIEGISQRKISRETGLGVMPIFYRVQKIRNKIKEAHNNSNDNT